MATHKVISVNVHVNRLDEKGFKEIEFDILNNYLEKGYEIADKFSTVPNGEANVVNFTFIICKEELEENRPRSGASSSSEIISF